MNLYIESSIPKNMSKYLRERQSVNLSRITNVLKDAHTKLCGDYIDSRVVIPLEYSENFTKLSTQSSGMTQLDDKLDDAIRTAKLEISNDSHADTLFSRHDLHEVMDDIFSNMSAENYYEVRREFAKSLKNLDKNDAKYLLNFFKICDALFKSVKQSTENKNYNIIISNAFEDIVLQSEGRYWENVSCKNFAHENFQYLDGEVGVIAIAYLVEGEPRYDDNELVNPIARIILIPSLVRENEKFRLKFLPQRIYHDSQGRKSLPPLIYKSFGYTVNKYLESKDLFTNSVGIIPNGVYDDIKINLKTDDTPQLPLHKFDESVNADEKFLSRIKSISNNMREFLLMGLNLDDDEEQEVKYICEKFLENAEYLESSINMSMARFFLGIYASNCSNDLRELSKKVFDEVIKPAIGNVSYRNIAMTLISDITKTQSKLHNYDPYMLLSMVNDIDDWAFDSLFAGTPDIDLDYLKLAVPNINKFLSSYGGKRKSEIEKGL